MRERLVLTTKTFNPMSEGADHGLSRERIRRQLETSLERLGVERVDLYLAHDMDPDTPLAETIGALRRARRAKGKIRAYGGSNVDAAWLEDALGSAAPTGCRTRTRCSSATTRPASSPSAPATGSATRRSARSRAAGSPASTAAASRRRRARG